MQEGLLLAFFLCISQNTLAYNTKKQCGERTLRKWISKFVEEIRKTPEKLLQYAMLVFLFGMAFLLPAHAVKYQARQRQEKQVQQEMESGASQSGAEGNGVSQSGITGAGDSGVSQNSAAGADGNGESQSNAGGAEGNRMSQSGASGTDSKGTIVLDPGHGGFDPGMTGSSGITEKELNLVYAKKLAALLEQAGYRVVLTRETEAGLYDETEANKKAQDMQRRCALIAQEQPLLTVSIHQNSYSDPAVCGPQVFYYEHSAEGERLAALIQNCMNEQLEIARPRVQKANGSYYILKRSASTTVLVEVGFLSNPEEEQILQEEEYQNWAMQAVCDGILQYLAEINGGAAKNSTTGESKETGESAAE